MSCWRVSRIDGVKSIANVEGNTGMKKFNDITMAELKASNLVTPEALGWAEANLEYLNKTMTLFGTSQKVEKDGDKANVYVMYLRPANSVSRITLCAAARLADCEKDCLIASGHLGMTQAQNAATKRTVLFLMRPQWFKRQLLAEIDKAEVKAKRDGIPAAFRLNGTSDVSFLDVIRQRPESQFYDYTKQAERFKDAPANYDLTYSGSMASPAARRSLGRAVRDGLRIALAINTKESKADALRLPQSLGGREVMSFDKNDLRYRDAKGAIGVLTSKGTSAAYRERLNKESDSFWVTQSNIGDLSDIIAKA